MSTNRLLVKLRPSSALRAADSRANVRPLFENRATAFGVDATPQWYIADLPDAGLPARSVSPWDLAHARVAAQLGIAESDVVFAEPDLIHDVYRDTNEEALQAGFAAGADCTETPQDSTHNKARGPADAWHLGDDFSQLAGARAAVAFTERRTRIAHIDTGYQPSHALKPAHILKDLERNFVDSDDNPGSATDPNNKVFLLDNSGHGTGTISILAGGKIPSSGVVLGGAPDADILPLRVADRVVLLRTSALARALDYAIQQGVDVITMSMGGLPSQAWAEAVDAVYDAGIVYCAAAGNHTGAMPPRVVVYPARYPRVIAVAGVMANRAPYMNLAGALEGSFGPQAVMAKALAAQMKATLEAVAEFDRQIEQLCRTHQDYEVFASLPGSGAVYSSRLLAAFGTDRTRSASAERVACLAGVAPVVERSGQQKWVHWRLRLPEVPAAELRRVRWRVGAPLLLGAGLLHAATCEGQVAPGGGAGAGLQVDPDHVSMLADAPALQ